MSESINYKDFREKYEIDRSKKGVRAIPKQSNGSKTKTRVEKLVESQIKPLKESFFVGHNLIKFIIPAVCPKPRMTQRDKWLKPPRDCVARYWKFVNQVQNFLPMAVPNVFHTIKLKVYIGMPKTWTKAKKDEMRGKLHWQKPDADNILKAVLDSITKEDKQVSNKQIEKFWSDYDRIEVEISDFN